MRKKRRRTGFTLIELLVVVAIIGLLAGLIVVNFNSARQRARDVQRKSDLDQVKKAVRMYYNDNNQYPSALPAWGTQFASSGGEVVYMRILPDDPSDGATYTYTPSSDNQDFCLFATLENKSDSDIAKSQSYCSDCSVGDDDYVVCAD